MVALAHTGRVLRWLYAGRLAVATAVFIAAVSQWLDPGSNQLHNLIATVALLGAAVLTGFGFWWVQVLRREPGRTFLYVQLVFDVLLVTAVVHVTGGPASPYPPLYILVITAAALLLPLPGGLLVGALASMLFIADAVVTAHADPGVSEFLRVGLFVVVAGATAWVGDRLRRTGTALGAAESALRQLRVDTDELLSSIDTALVTVDGAGRLVHVNRASAHLLGLPLEPGAAEPVLEQLDRVAPGLGTLIRRTAAAQVPAGRFEIRRPSAAGERFLGVRTTVLQRDGMPLVTAVLQDITDAKRLEELIRRAERLQATAELGASLAHEIRNPLASIRSAAEQLSLDRLDEAERGMLRALVLREADRVSRLLAEFMEFSRVDAPCWAHVDLGTLATDVIRDVEQHPEGVSTVRIDYDGPVEPLYVHGDIDLLRRALFHLVLNAVQHAGPDGAVTVLLECPPAGPPAPAPLDAPVRLAVSDSGPGLQAEDIPHLFDPFFKRRSGGTGLGLALVHRAVEAHGGTVLADAAPGGGARFTIYLPARVGEEQLHGAELR
jgi:two-component system, NtrC family, sensor histidine kinase PilS